jgi:Fe-S cluster assembly ATPase SufC
VTPPQTNDVAYTLEIRDLHANAGDTQILNGINLTVRSGEVHAVMGPNGAGKSTLSAVIMGKPGYTVTEGSIPNRNPWGGHRRAAQRSTHRARA